MCKKFLIFVVQTTYMPPAILRPAEKDILSDKKELHEKNANLQLTPEKILRHSEEVDQIYEKEMNSYREKFELFEFNN